MIYYWIAILDNIKNMVGMVGFFSVFTTILSTVGYVMACMEQDENLVKVVKTPCKISWTVSILAMLITVFVPSQKQAAFIVVAPAIVENKDVQSTLKNLPELSKLGTEYLVEMLKDAKKTSNQ